MTTWAVEVDYDGGQKDGRITTHLVINDVDENLMATIEDLGHVYRFEARRYEPGDLAKLAFTEAGARATSRYGTGPEGGAPR